MQLVFLPQAQAQVGQILTVERRKPLVFLSLIDCRINGCNWTHTYDTRGGSAHSDLQNVEF